ncbi:MAG: hypothetical protein V3T22_07595 [Planctomycetota bacterium]
MKRSLIASALLLLVASGCQAPAKDVNDHWTAKSVMPSISRYVLGYDADRDGDIGDWFWNDMRANGLTLRRHLINENPYNPNHLSGRPQPVRVSSTNVHAWVEPEISGAITRADGVYEEE